MIFLFDEYFFLNLGSLIAAFAMNIPIRAVVFLSNELTGQSNVLVLDRNEERRLI